MHVHLGVPGRQSPCGTPILYEERSLGTSAEDEIPAADPKKATADSTRNRRRHHSSSSVFAALRQTSERRSRYTASGPAPHPPTKTQTLPINFTTQQIRGQLAHDI
ncbi:uncharacterized protein B0H64DRAFT_241422 [Chaetomium fimeti]|uniref:Uncharacterized protein n=1 Tax=Chaetomium fimeti TaxID=1854472 RepID=A0AAE0H8B8_9PEZI|nr:hypothetical protein B0H64DRAFT_241422 [Chaetomium fimeti]